VPLSCHSDTPRHILATISDAINLLGLAASDGTVVQCCGTAVTECELLVPCVTTLVGDSVGWQGWCGTEVPSGRLLRGNEIIPEQN
jgi:hypothetical protein